MSKITKINVGGVDYELGGSGSAQVIETTYAQLKELVDASGLTPGNRYRITDFVSIYNDYVKSANHPFDLIVTACSANAFYPKAEAAKHEGDEYFANNDLSKWEIWYDFTNDTTRCAFANKNDGKGLIYRMIDENNNDANYDFKNLLVTKDQHGFHSAFETNDGEAYFYTFSYAESTSPADLVNTKDFSTVFPDKCKNNTIRMEMISSDPFNGNGHGIVLGVCKGLLNSSISNNHIEGLCFIFSYTTISGKISNNISLSTFEVKVVCGLVTENMLNNGKFSIGPQNWEESTHGLTLGEISGNFFMKNLLVYGQETNDLSFTYNIVKPYNVDTFPRILQKASIKGCEIIGTFSSSGVEISEAQDSKLIVGKGDTLAIIDPATFYTS